MNHKEAAQPTHNSLRNSTKSHLESRTDKKLSKERILRKTTTYEVLEKNGDPPRQQQKVFTPEPKKFRIRRGHTIVRRRCNGIMKHLWQMGFKHGALVKRETVEAAIFYCAGGDYRTIKKYMGFRKLLRKGNALCPPQTLYIKGYLERLRYIERAKAGNFYLRHEAVPLPYHYVEQLIPPNPPSPNFVNAGLSKEVLCVRSEASLGDGEGHGKEGAIGSIQRNKTNKHNTHKSV